MKAQNYMPETTSLKFSTSTILIALCVLIALISTAAQAETVVSASDLHISYTGRIDFSNHQAPELSWPASSIALNFTGTYLAVTLDDQRGENYFNAFLDDDFSRAVVLHCQPGRQLMSFAISLHPARIIFY